MVRAVFVIAVKDLRLRLRDRSALVIGVAAPFLLAFVLNQVAGDLFSSDRLDLDAGLVDEDGGDLADGFREMLAGLDGLDLTVADNLDLETARARVDSGDLDAVFVLPDGLSESAQQPEADGRTELRVIGNVDAPIATQVATSVADGFTQRVEAVRLSVVTALADGADGDVEALVAEAGEAGETTPVTVESGEATDRQLGTSTYLIAGLSMLFLFLLVGLGTTSLLQEKREGTLARLLAAPVPRSAVPLAKALSCVALAVLALGVLAVSSTLVMGASWGPVGAVAVLCVAASLAATSLMGIVTAVARTPERAGQAQGMVAMVLAILGGSFFPVSQAGDVISRLTVLTPHHWFLRGLGEASAGGLTAALPAVGALLLFALVAGSVGAVLVPRTVQQ